MKKTFLTILVYLIYSNILQAQINQQDSMLSSYLRYNFPYESVVTNNCDSQFIGCFYISFTINNERNCSNISFSGLSDSTILKVFQTMLSSSQLKFSDSFLIRVKYKTIVQPVFYSYFNCIKFTPEEDEENKMAESCYVYNKTVSVISQRIAVMNKSINEGLTFSKTTGYYEGIILNPCIIDVNPKKRLPAGFDLRQEKHTKAEIDMIERRIKERRNRKDN